MKRYTGCTYRISALPEKAIEAWRRMQNEVPSLKSPFLSFEYVRACAEVAPEVSVCVVEEDGEIAGILPLHLPGLSYRLFGAAVRPGSELSDHFSLISDRQLQLAPADLLRMARIGHLYVTHATANSLPSAFTLERPQTGLLIDLGDEPGAFWKGMHLRDPKFARDTERRMRKLQTDHGTLHFEFHCPKPLAELERLIAAKRMQYGQSGVADSLRAPWTRALLRKLLQLETDACRGVLSTLYAGDQWIASQYSLRAGGILHDWFPVYDSRFASYAPGRLLLKLIIDAAPGFGINTVDRGLGDTKAKRDFATREVTYYRGAWHRPGIRSFVWRALCSAKWRMEQSASRTTHPALSEAAADA